MRLFVIDGRDGRAEGVVFSVYVSRSDSVATAKRRAIEQLMRGKDDAEILVR